jgi:hypothetical protein
MSNGAYAEIAKLIKEGALSGDVESRLTIELQMEIHEAVTDIAAQVAKNNTRISELERYPSIGYYFRNMPAKTVGAIATSWIFMELISEEVLPRLIGLLFSLP